MLGAPTRHPAREETAEPANANRGRQPGGHPGILVVATDQDDLLLAVRDPGEPRAAGEARQMFRR
jgi:hypothetical protein